MLVHVLAYVRARKVDGAENDIIGFRLWVCRTRVGDCETHVLCAYISVPCMAVQSATLSCDVMCIVLCNHLMKREQGEPRPANRKRVFASTRAAMHGEMINHS